MPYLKGNDRQRLLQQKLKDLSPETSGELNYCITTAVQHYLPDIPSYEDYDLAIGAIEAAKFELYRRRISEYEDTKIELNGDVY